MAKQQEFITRQEFNKQVKQAEKNYKSIIKWLERHEKKLEKSSLPKKTKVK